MSRVQAFVVVGLLVLWAADPVAAQDEGGRAIFVYAHGGGFSPVTDLNDAGTAGFKTGFDVGGGVGVQLNKYLALRGNFTVARATARGASSFSRTKFNRFFYDADVQLRYPLEGGVSPYLFAGGGGVTIDQSGSAGQPTFTKAAGKVGIGLSYQIPKSNVGLYAEGTGWIYKWDRNGFDKTQFDTTWSGGISYRFGL